MTVFCHLVLITIIGFELTNAFIPASITWFLCYHGNNGQLVADDILSADTQMMTKTNKSMKRLMKSMGRI